MRSTVPRLLIALVLCALSIACGPPGCAIDDFGQTSSALHASPAVADCCADVAAVVADGAGWRLEVLTLSPGEGFGPESYAVALLEPAAVPPFLLAPTAQRERWSRVPDDAPARQRSPAEGSRASPGV